ncbi:MAG: InlB B-repeat-containing protein, partial [Anaerovoracaceae bacterium]
MNNKKLIVEERMSMLEEKMKIIINGLKEKLSRENYILFGKKFLVVGISLLLVLSFIPVDSFRLLGTAAEIVKADNPDIDERTITNAIKVLDFGIVPVGYTKEPRPQEIPITNNTEVEITSLTTPEVENFKFEWKDSSGEKWDWEVKDLAASESVNLEVTPNISDKSQAHDYSTSFSTESTPAGLSVVDYPIKFEVSTAATWIVTFNSNTGSGETPYDKVIQGQPLYLPSGSTLSKKGYDFAGWNTLANGTGIKRESSYVPSGNDILYAQWKEKEYKITLSSNDISGGPSMVLAPVPNGNLGKYKYETELTWKNPTANSGYRFDKITKLIDTTEEIREGETDQPVTITSPYLFKDDHKIALIANYVKTYNLPLAAGTNGRVELISIVPNPAGENTADINTGKARTLTPDKGATIKFTAVPEAGYHFVKWTGDADISENSAAQEIVDISKDYTASKASFAANEYTIKYKAGIGGTGTHLDQSITFAAGTLISANDSAEKFERNGYNFAGWNTKEDGTGTSFVIGSSANMKFAENNGEVTLYAQWFPGGALKATIDLGENVVKKQGQTSNIVADDSYTASFATYTGYKLPSTISITQAGFSLIETKDYLYNSTNGKITISAGRIKGDLVITIGDAIANINNVIFKRAHLTLGDGAKTAKTDETYNGTLTPEMGYELPNDIIITQEEGVKNLERNVHYTYDKATGSFTIKSYVIKSAITVTASAVAKSGNVVKTTETSVENGNLINLFFSVTSSPFVTGTDPGIMIKPAKGYTLPSAISASEIIIKVGSNGSQTTLIPGEGFDYIYDSKSGEITITLAGRAKLIGDVSVELSNMKNGIPKKYQIKYDLNGGTVNEGSAPELSETTKTYGTASPLTGSVDEPLANIVGPGCKIFAGWYTNATGSGGHLYTLGI